MASNKTALLGCAAALLVMSSGCAGMAPGNVALRPDGSPRAEKCPEGAFKAMESLQLAVGDAGIVVLDANQTDTSPITLYDGPVESFLDDDLGLLESPARLYGHVWTSGAQVVVRYYEAHPLRGGKRVPICAVARAAKGQLRKRADSKPGTAILEFPRAGVYIVDEFR